MQRTGWLRGALSRVVLVAVVACSQAAVDRTGPNVNAAEVSTSVRWNRRAVALVVARQPASNGQAAVSRILTYVSLAQYRAVQAAAKDTKHASVSAAVGAASAVVLNSFFPLDVASTEAQLNGDLAIPPWPGAPVEDVAAGEALGRSIGSAVVAQAAGDNYLALAPGAVPTGTGKWTPSTAAIVRSLYGTKPFFLTTPEQLRPPAPPEFGSPAYTEALAEVRQISDTRTAEQTQIAVNWNTSSGTFTAGALNFIVDDLLQERRVSELEAARILAFANAATFDAQIACWEAKFTYWFIRPSQADPGITMPIALPNHPSYPSGHSCMTAAMLGVVADAFPDQRARLEGLVQEAGMSRVYGGIHYRFDIDAGRDIGLAAAALALKSTLK
jgi:membrane-associated phospholipid phosphatase